MALQKAGRQFIKDFVRVGGDGSHGNLRCESNDDGVSTLYSYATPIAKRFRAGVFWVTTEKFSVTTSGHTGAVASAIADRGADLFRVGINPGVTYRSERVPNTEDEAVVAHDEELSRE